MYGLKKFFSFLMVLCLFVPLLSVGASNSESEMLPTQDLVATGKTFCVQVNVSTDSPIYAIEAKLKYDTTKLEPVITDEISAKGDYVYSVQGDGGGTLKTFGFYFKAKEKGECSFTLYDVYYVDNTLTKRSVSGGTCSKTIYLAGDVNNDGEVNVLDLMALKRYLAGKNNTPYYSTADFNDTGSIEAADLISLQKEILK